MVETFDILRSLHMLFAVLWAGGVIFYGPIVMLGFMQGEDAIRRTWWTKGKFGPYFGITSLLALVFGLAAFYSGGAPDYGDGAQNTILNMGIGFGGLGFLLGWAGLMPLNVMINRAIKAGDDARLARLERRDMMVGVTTLVVVLLTTLCMVTFRLFPYA